MVLLKNHTPNFQSLFSDGGKFGVFYALDPFTLENRVDFTPL